MDLALLDTDQLSEVIKLRNPVVRQRALAYSQTHTQLAFSAITRYEITRGYREKNASKQLARFAVFCFTSLDDGVVTVLKAGTDKPEVVAKNPGLGERVAATPAIADNALYIRSEKHLYAFGKKK